MTPRNLLFIMSDEHSRRVLGCYGHPMIKTPNLDRLAARGVRFTDAYCNSPICVPSWAHRLTQAGHRATSIRKLHFRSTEDDNGFSEEIMPLHVVDGVGDPL